MIFKSECPLQVTDHIAHYYRTPQTLFEFYIVGLMVHFNLATLDSVSSCILAI